MRLTSWLAERYRKITRRSGVSTFTGADADRTQSYPGVYNLPGYQNGNIVSLPSNDHDPVNQSHHQVYGSTHFVPVVATPSISAPAATTPKANPPIKRKPVGSGITPRNPASPQGPPTTTNGDEPNLVHPQNGDSPNLQSSLRIEHRPLPRNRFRIDDDDDDDTIDGDASSASSSCSSTERYDDRNTTFVPRKDDWKRWGGVWGEDRVC